MAHQLVERTWDFIRMAQQIGHQPRQERVRQAMEHKHVRQHQHQRQRQQERSRGMSMEM